jgi:hypothetical protein
LEEYAMKKTVTKLQLNRETLRSLAEDEKPLQAVVGGFTVFTCIGHNNSCNACPAM